MFKFKLQPVLEHRRMGEDDAKRRFEAAQRELNEARRELGVVELGILRESERIRRAQKGGMDFMLRSLHENWIAGQRILAAHWKKTEAERVKVVEQRRLELIEATRCVKIMEKLYERQERAWRREEDRREQTVFDEIAVREFNQSRRWEKDAQPSERIAS